MDIKVIATTGVGHIADKEEFDVFSGRTAGVCYMSSSFAELENEDREKTIKRMKLTKTNGHHSVFDHETISLYLDNVPKILAMILNNEKQYATSEKSARYTKMVLTQKEQTIYNKWIEIFKTRIIKKKYNENYPQFFTASRIEKLAQENARYLISVFTPTSLVYTTTYRQFNYLIAFMESFINKPIHTDFQSKVASVLQEFVQKLKSLQYYDEKLSVNDKNRHLSLFADDKPSEEYFGDVYCTMYKASFAELAQAQRHRTINYKMRVLENEYYVPEIIKDSEDLTALWIDDIKSLGNIYPQATMLEITEMGTLDNFILKMYERKCTFAQLEINKVTIETLKKYEYSLRLKIHPRAEELRAYLKGSRCTFPNYKCASPCGFALGVNETRDI